ncbi:MAG: efflux transporter, family, subunit [Gemmatimonadetes bacterium]|nr:efflux transporter, family, subunit [Gemmatimonadota bacterium]
MSRRVLTMNVLTRLSAVGIALLAVACKKGGAPADSAQPRPTVGAKTMVVTPQAFTETLGAIGNVVGRPNHTATLAAPSAARVERVLVMTGQSVQVGQVLIELDQAPFQATVRSADAALQAAERAYERQQRLANEGIVARKDAELAAADLAKSRADAEAAHRMAALSILKSPIAGVVVRLTATLGASADPAQPLVEVADPSALDVLMSVTPTDASRVHPGAKATLSAGQSASGEPLGVGTVTDVGGTVDSTNRSVAVRVQAPTTRRPLRIGETVFGQIVIETKPSAIVIPIEALVPQGDAFQVFVVDANNIAHARDVKVGGKTDTSVEITEGLKAGERIVTYGAYGVQDSAKVVPPTVVPAQGDSAAKPVTPVKP